MRRRRSGPDRLTVWPSENGSFGIDVRWYGRECILRAVVVRRLLSEAGYPATVGNSIDGRNWELTRRPGARRRGRQRDRHLHLVNGGTC